MAARLRKDPSGKPDQNQGQFELTDHRATVSRICNQASYAKKAVNDGGEQYSNGPRDLLSERPCDQEGMANHALGLAVSGPCDSTLAFEKACDLKGTRGGEVCAFLKLVLKATARR